MKIYLAGFDPGNEERISELFKLGHKLHSYYHVQVSGSEKFGFKTNVKNKVDIFLDSGGYSALTQGVKISIQEYMDFIKEYEHALTSYANLDVIAVKKGQPPNRESAECTLINQKIMEDAGFKPIPVFHYQEPFEFLEWYVEKYDYIALGGAVGHPTRFLMFWLDKCFQDYICDPKTGIPRVKVHGFGITAVPLLFRYPWYSVDSSSWTVGSRTGNIYVPRMRNGEWVYDEKSWIIAVSNRNPQRKNNGEHIFTLSPRQREVVLDYIHSKGYKLGESRFERVPQTHKLADNEKWAERKPKDKNSLRLLEILEVEGVSNNYNMRNELNIIYFLDLEKHLPPWNRPFKVPIMRRFMGME